MSSVRRDGDHLRHVNTMGIDLVFEGLPSVKNIKTKLGGDRILFTRYVLKIYFLINSLIYMVYTDSIPLYL